MKNKLVGLTIGAVFLLISVGGSVYAHHGFIAWFDMTHSITVKGTVTTFDWTNPHAYINFDVKDAKGATEKWSAELGGITMLARIGWKRDMLKPGDEITLVGFRAKDGKPAMLLDKAILANGQELHSSIVNVPIEGFPDSQRLAPKQ